jgi:hypothetical protein
MKFLGGPRLLQGLIVLVVFIGALPAFSSHEKLERVFGPMPKTPLHGGLAKTWEWALGETLASYRLGFDIEVSRNMPPSWR